MTSFTMGVAVKPTMVDLSNTLFLLWSFNWRYSVLMELAHAPPFFHVGTRSP